MLNLVLNSSICLHVFGLSIVHRTETLIILIDCFYRRGADGTDLGENRSFVPTSSSYRKLCSSLQGPLEILVIAPFFLSMVV